MRESCTSEFLIRSGELKGFMSRIAILLFYTGLGDKLMLQLYIYLHFTLLHIFISPKNCLDSESEYTVIRGNVAGLFSL